MYLVRPLTLSRYPPLGEHYSPLVDGIVVGRGGGDGRRVDQDGVTG